MGEYSVDAFCGKLCACGGVIAFIDGSSGTYPPTSAIKSASEGEILQSQTLTVSECGGEYRDEGK